MSKAFTSFVDLDSVTIVCPCGESVSGEGDRVAEFRAKHLKHTDGVTKEHITDDGMKALKG